uniref:Expressed conserved protein n=2 Tax=Mesocestoides corti TaxID=53468 RepID=A0A5K3FKJ7_MESCO
MFFKMHRSSSFVILDADVSLPGSESEDIVGSLSSASIESSKESSLSPVELIEAPLVYDRAAYKAGLELEKPLSEANLHCDSDVQSPGVFQEEPSNEPQEVRETQSQIVEALHPLPENHETAVDEQIRSESNGHTQNTGQFFNVFFRVIDAVNKVYEITSHIDNTSKVVALCVLIIGVLLSTATVFLLPHSKSVVETDFLSSDPVNCDVSAELAKCKQLLNWRQEKIQQFESKLENLNSRFKSSQQSLGECRWSLSDSQEKNKKCGSSLEGLKKKLENLESLYEKSRNMIIELQDKIINYQSDEPSERQPFFKKAFDTLFGHSWGRGHRGRRSRRRT